MYLHQVLSQCTGLVGTNHGNGPHGFASMHLAHQVVGLEHTAHVQSQTQSDAHRQTFWHGYYNQCYGHHEIFQDDAGDVHPFLPTCNRGYGQILVQVLAGKDDEGKNGDGEAYLLDKLGKLGKLDIQRSFFIALFGSLSGNLSDFGGITHFVHLHDAMTVGYGGTTHHLVAWISRFLVERSFIGGLVHH